jgi:hypothetical protein
MDVADDFHDHDDDSLDHECECPCHDGGKHEYRLMRGYDIEGISIREVVCDKNDKIVGWASPELMPTATIKEAKENLEYTIDDLMDMHTAFDKPILDEVKLEAELEVND